MLNLLVELNTEGYYQQQFYKHYYLGPTKFDKNTPYVYIPVYLFSEFSTLHFTTQNSKGMASRPILSHVLT